MIRSCLAGRPKGVKSPTQVPLGFDRFRAMPVQIVLKLAVLGYLRIDLGSEDGPPCALLALQSVALDTGQTVLDLKNNNDKLCSRVSWLCPL